jgi:signal transduction histidine kinase
LAAGGVSRLPDARSAVVSPSSYVINGALYPVWHVLAPEGARDPVAAWFAIGAWLVATGTLATLIPALRLQSVLLAAAPYVVAVHLFALATLNVSEPFYAIGSVMSIALTAMSTRSQRALRSYTLFVAILAGSSYLVTRESSMLAYWGAMLLMLVFAHLWLRGELEAERIQQEHRHELESAIAERTRELADANAQLRAEMEERRALEEKLRLAHKMEALGRLAGGVAHDYNNILTTVLGHASLLLDSVAPDTQEHRDLTLIQGAAQRAAALTGQLLAFSRGGVVETSILPANELIEEMQPMLLRLLREDVQLDCELEADLPMIRVNRSQFEQVLINLVANARDAMPHGGRVRISTSTRGPASHPRVVLRVSDTGIGMDADTRARIFDPFFTTKGPEAGTGLGLSIVYGIVQQAGGEVRVESAPGEGSQFEVLLPPAVGAPEIRKPLDLDALWGRERVLVVEDEPELRRLVCRMLSQFGYAPIEVHSGEQALKRIAREPIDLLITDVVMPQMSGPELVRRIEESGRRIPVLFVSGHLDHPIARRSELPPGAHLLAKPFTRERLCEKVRQALDSAGGGDG